MRWTCEKPASLEIREVITSRGGTPPQTVRYHSWVVYHGRKGMFVKHGKPGYSVFIDIDDEYFETSAKSISLDPDYNYTEKTPNAVSRVK